MVRAGVLASGGEDRRVCVWDLEKTAAPGAAPEPGLEKRAGRSIPQLVFSHAGHRASVSYTYDTYDHVSQQHMEWGMCKLS